MIAKPTRITRHSETLIDLIFTKRPERIIKTYNLITELSDHNMTLIVRKLTKKRFLYHNKIETKIQTTGIPKAKLNDFEHDLNQVNWDIVTSESDLNESAINFITTVSDLQKKYTKTWLSKPKKFCLPWFNIDI